MTVDTLGYVKRLEAAGVPRAQAEAHAEALRDEIAPQLVTSADLGFAVDRLETRIDHVEERLGARIDALDAKFENRFDALDAKFEGRIDNQTQRIEAMIWKAAVAILGGGLAIGGLLIRFLR